MSKRRNAFSILEIMIVVAIISLLAAIAIPNFIKARERSSQKACINNLRQISDAILRWSLDARALPSDVVTSANLLPYLKSPPSCPTQSGGSFATSYGMTFVKDLPYCVSNTTLSSYPHTLSTNGN
jgi:prepilin-type N-terminal cleavage/methylation domain-containing protein